MTPDVHLGAPVQPSPVDLGDVAIRLWRRAGSPVTPSCPAGLVLLDQVLAEHDSRDITDEADFTGQAGRH